MTVQAIDLGILDGLFMQLNGVTFDDPSQGPQPLETQLPDELVVDGTVFGDRFSCQAAAQA